MLKLSAKHCFLLGFLFCVGLILSAFYFQFIGHLDPCPLCISQRVMVVAVGLVMLVIDRMNGLLPPGSVPWTVAEDECSVGNRLSRDRQAGAP